MGVRFDIVGDVHGMRQTLDALVRQLGYHQSGSQLTHPQQRRLVFVGDLLDRGPDPLGCLEWVAQVVSTGQALMVLGNHEINALHFMAGLRDDNPRTRGQFASTLKQIDARPDRWQEAARFLATVPTRLLLDEGRLRVVHACWDEDQLDRLPVYLDTPELLKRTSSGGDLLDAVEICLKGPEEESEPFQDKDGRWHKFRRMAWWEQYPVEAPRVVFGHYWFPWTHDPSFPTAPAWMAPGKNAACLDYSAGKGGPLVALRYPELTFVSQPGLDLQPT